MLLQGSRRSTKMFASEAALQSWPSTTTSGGQSFACEPDLRACDEETAVGEVL
jgi:hypothetical protein